MRSVRLVVSILVTTLLAGFSANCQESITSVVQKVKPAVVTVATYGKDGSEGSVAGFFVDESHIITSLHAMDGAAKADVKSAAGKVYKVKGIDGFDEISDIARLVLEKPVKDIPVLTLAKSMPENGERIIIVGSHEGLESTVTHGTVSAVRDIQLVGKFIQLDVTILPGSSGSPVVNLEGEVVGVVTPYLADGKNRKFVVAEEQVKNLKPTKVTALGNVTLPANVAVIDPLKKGLVLYLDYEYEKALPHFGAVIKADPNNSLVWMLQGDCYSQLNRYDEAINAYKQAIRIDPNRSNVRYNLGNAYLRLERYDEAIDSYKQAIRISADHAKAYNGLGSAYGGLGRHDEALEAFKQAIRINPNFDAAYYNMGNAYMRQKRYTEAVDAYKEAIRIYPHAKPYFMLGLAYSNLGQYDDSIDAYKQAIRLNSNHSDAHFNLGVDYLKTNNKSAALEEYKILTTLDPEKAKKLLDIISSEDGAPK